jgi:hypothetical protein
MSLARFGASKRIALNASRSKAHFLLPIWDADHQKCKNVFPPFSRSTPLPKLSPRKPLATAAYAPCFNEKMLYGFVHLNFFSCFVGDFSALDSSGNSIMSWGREEKRTSERQSS